MAITLNTFAPNTKMESAKVNTNFSNVSDAIRPTFVFTIAGTMVAGTNQTAALIVPAGMTVEKVYAYAKTAPTGANLIVDINKNGTSIWASNQANRVNIVASSQSGSQTAFDTTSLVEGDVITVDVDQIGSTIAGADLTIQIKCSTN
ncbi:MAG: hypothetical protein KCHDKBKB_00606 [Elusimicrobia bacterium]|nr:hypothetical protein [Elusimicrobiota bacterium]